MNTTAVYENVSPLDALWSLFISQPKSVRKAFTKRLLSQDRSALAEQQRTDIGCSLKRAMQELEKAETSGLETLPDATTLFN